MSFVRVLSLAVLLALPSAAFTQTPQPSSSTRDAQPTGLLSASATEKLLPPSVLYKGQQAPVQVRNSGAVRYPEGSLLIVSMVDSSGYSSGIRERYQFFLYTELALRFGEKVLPPGFYGGGFLQDNSLLVTDVAGHEVLSAPTVTDSEFKRPRPLQILAAPGSEGSFRLYVGRAYVALIPAAAPTTP